VTSSLAVFEAAIYWYVNASDKIMLENQKNRIVGMKDIFYTNLHLKDRLNVEFTACSGELMPQEASADIIYRIWRISPVCGSGSY